MRQHHQQAIQRLVQRYQDDRKFLALILVGSIAKGQERDDSDIDVVLVATDEEFLRRKSTKDYQFHDSDMCNYPGGYYDVKVVNLEFLVEAGKRGNEITRSSFTDAKILYAHVSNLQSILDKIPVYQEHEQYDKLQSFYSQLLAAHWWALEAINKHDKFLLYNAVSELVLFSSRIILAQNKVLFCSHKELISEIRKITIKPDMILSMMNNLLQEPTIQNIDEYYHSIMNFDGWMIRPKLSIGWYLENNAWSWLDGKSNIQFL